MPRGGNRQGAGRKGGWKNSETQVIRVPKILAAQILEYAKKLDSGEFQCLGFASLLDVNQSIDEVGSHDLNLDEIEISLLASVLNDSATQSFSLILDSVTESEDHCLDTVTESKVLPSKPDGKRWLSSEQAWNIAVERGCDRSLNGFRSWSKRHPDKCLDCFSLCRLESMQGRTSTPAFEDLLHSDDPDYQDF